MTEPFWVVPAVVLAIHERQVDEHGGAAGLRDEGLLQSALARPRQMFAYGAPDLYDLAAAYTSGIVRNHPFVDGNKRTGFVTGVVFLVLNGVVFSAPETDATKAMFELAAGETTEEHFAAWLRSNGTAA